ncbi:hypothetical protein Dda_0479 [Drechslerella dactyloides]|uniref:CUE domain-containing protein n=1 Tax=Drechslerella dactyloides TaxID=74499 RepID=A0AAD6J6F1_DREDA|nr:hypothetical protein Dda_0479 [Drechslerella dactyloides]
MPCSFLGVQKTTCVRTFDDDGVQRPVDVQHSDQRDGDALAAHATSHALAGQHTGTTALRLTGRAHRSLALAEPIGVQQAARLHHALLVADPEFLHDLLRARLADGEVAQHRLRHVERIAFAGADLHGPVAVRLGRLVGHHLAAVDLQDGARRPQTLAVKDGGHALLSREEASTMRIAAPGEGGERRGLENRERDGVRDACGTGQQDGLLAPGRGDQAAWGGGEGAAGSIARELAAAGHRGPGHDVRRGGQTNGGASMGGIGDGVRRRRRRGGSGRRSSSRCFAWWSFLRWYRHNYATEEQAERTTAAMSSAAEKLPALTSPSPQDGPPVIPPKERSPSPDDGLLREEPLEAEVKPSTTIKSTDVPTATAPSNPAQTATAPPAPTVEDEEAPPPKPPRPVSQFEQNVATLAEAFPDIDLAVVKAVLTASRGQVEDAFNALLGMSDPSAAVEMEEAPPPPRPPRPRPQQQQQQQQPRDFRGSDYSPAAVYHDQPQPKTSTSASQLEADELYARQLAEHYGGIPSDRSRQGRGGRGNYPDERRRQTPQQTGTDEDDRERSFFDDDLPVIRENIRKGFLETQTKVNKFIADMSKKLSGEEEEQQAAAGGLSPRPAGGYRPPQQQHQPQQYPQRYSSRRSGDAYDADPELIQGDFSHLELRDNTEEPRRTRPLANPDLFGSATAPQGAKSGTKTVAFANQSDDDLYRKPAGIPTAASTTAPGSTTAANSNATTGSKWAPLASVEPTPLTNDPFQLADSDDEHDTIQTTAAKTGPQESGTKDSGTKPATK